MNKTINIITLGCSKNIVDSEIIAARLQKLGHRVSTPAVSSAMRAKSL